MDREQVQVIKTELRDPERRYVKAYLDFLDCPLLSLEEKVIYLCLKKYLDFRSDNNGSPGEVYPSLKDIAGMTGSSLPTITKLIRSLADKGVIEKKVRGLNQTNVYVISDRSWMWKAQTLEELKCFARETEEERSVRVLKAAGFSLSNGEKMIPGEKGISPPDTPDPFADVGEIDKSRFAVKARDRERIYVKVYMDFLDSGILNLREIGMFILLKRFIDVREDSGSVYPSIKTLEERAGKRHTAIIGIINSLVEKGVVEKKQRGLTQTNLYLITDRASMWASKSYEEVGKRAKETEVDVARELLQNQGYQIWKADESAPVEKKPSRGKNRKTPSTVTKVPAPDAGLPEPVYTQEFLYDHTGMTRMIQNRKNNRIYRPFTVEELDLIDICMNVLLETLNSKKKTISVNGESKPASVVRGVYLKLKAEQIIYAVDQYQKSLVKITRPAAYLRTVLYNAALDYQLAEVNDIQRSLDEGGFDLDTINSHIRKG